MRGTLILIEGLDRSGKSTQVDLLHRRLGGKLVKFPDRTTRIGGIINQYLVDPSFTLTDQSAHLLFSANRWEVVPDIIAALERGESVVMDRYIYSGIAYSLAKSKTGTNDPQMGDVQWLYSPDKGLPKPDLTLFLTLSLEELSRRKGWGDERYEKEAFQKSVRECFLEILDPADPLIEIVDVNGMSIQQVHLHLWKIIEERGLDQPTGEPLGSL